MGIFQNPLAIDVLRLGNSSSDSGPWVGANDGALGAPRPVIGHLAFGGALYSVLLPPTGFSGSIQDTGTPKRLSVFKSIDAGLTWAEVDAAGATSTTAFNAVFNGVSRVICVVSQPKTSPTLSPLNVIEFDLLSDTWGALSADSPALVPPIGATSTPMGGALGIYPRSDGSILILYCGVFSPSAELWAVNYNAGSWGTPFQVDLAGRAVFGASSLFRTCVGCVDASDVLHLFYEFENSALTDVRVFYQRITAADTLGASQELSFGFDYTNALSPDGVSMYGLPAMFAGLVVLPVFTSTAGVKRIGVYVGSAVGAPAWLLLPNIDSTLLPAFPADSIGCYGGMTAIVNGGQLTVLYMLPSASFPGGAPCIVREVSTSDLATWAPSTLYDLTTDGPAAFARSGAQSIYNPMVTSEGLSFSAYDASGTIIQRWFLLPAGGLPVLRDFKIQLIGWQLFPIDPCSNETAEPLPPVKWDRWPV